ncbi:MAG: hypothetical protein ACK55K_03105 [Bacteroidota bacterium]
MEQRKHSYCYISVTLLWLSYFITWPFYKYVLDPDGASYASIAEQYANGYFTEAINSVWSPLHEWLIIPFIKMGIYTPYAFKFSNLLIGTGVLITIHLYLLKSNLDKAINKYLLLCLPVILCYFIWFELAADILFCLIVLIYLKLTQDVSFYNDYKKNILVGCIGGFGYLAKGVGLPFFLIHYTLIHFWNNWSFNRFKYYLSGLFFFILISAPWIIILHSKYNIWLYSSAGALNMSWLLTPSATNELFCMPPPNQYAFSYWEDPWFVQDIFHSPFDNLNQFVKSIRHVLYNVQEYVKVFIQISFLSISIVFISLVNLIHNPSKKNFYIFISIFLLPTGYILFHYEYRYLWPISLFIMITGIHYLKHLFIIFPLIKRQRILIWLIYFSSFLIEPINQLKDLAYKNRDLYDLATLLQKNNIEDSFTSNKKNNECAVVAYINRIKYFAPNQNTVNIHALLSIAKKQNIKYCLFFYKNDQEKTCILSSIPNHDYKSVKHINHQIIAFEL